jgi:hypothetical protein
MSRNRTLPAQPVAESAERRGADGTRAEARRPETEPAARGAPASATAIRARAQRRCRQRKPITFACVM